MMAKNYYYYYLSLKGNTLILYTLEFNLLGTGSKKKATCIVS